jgi:3-hydroxyacyl-[acyl-carrier-protein] dehydratase
MPLEIDRIMAMLPHRYPFLLVDRVLEFTENNRLRALKNVSINEPFFQGHFPGHPVMPGVLIIEALAQASGLLVQLSTKRDGSAQPLYYLVKVDKAKFTRIVVPGDQLTLDVELKRMIRRMGLFVCRASVAGNPVAEAELLCAERAAG